MYVRTRTQCHTARGIHTATGVLNVLPVLSVSHSKRNPHNNRGPCAGTQHAASTRRPCVCVCVWCVEYQVLNASPYGKVLAVLRMGSSQTYQS